MSDANEASAVKDGRRVAVVTGGSRGLGRALVVEASRRGYDVVFSHRDRGSDAEDTINEAAIFGTAVLGVEADVTNRADLDRVAASALDLGPVHVLINNAGTLIGGTLEETTDQAWRDSFAIHVTAPMLLTRALAKALSETHGAVLNVASAGGVVGSVHGAAYGASKAATIGLSKTMARELAPQVRVNSIAPGPISTDMWGALPEASQRKVEAETPLQRVGRPDEIARACLDICSWTYLTGQTLVVNGGRVMQ